MGDTANKNVLTAEVFSSSIFKQRNDPELKKFISSVVYGLFDIMDVNLDGYLQEDEHRRLFHQLGVPDTSYSEDIFNAIDLNHDGKLSFQEFIEACYDFFFSEDENSPNTLFFGPLVV